MNYANDFTKTFELADDILSIGAKAKKRKSVNPDCIDATIGALLDDSGKLLAFQSIESQIRSMDSTKLRAYPPVDGGEPFKTAVSKWVFGPYYDQINSHFTRKVLATPGASGALSTVLGNYVSTGDLVLLPDIFWSNYQAIINQTGASYVTYPLFEGAHFNIKGFIEKAQEVATKTHKLVVLINDPCQNPTGYSLSKEELKKIISALDELGKIVPVVFIYDIAYLDYADQSFKETRERFNEFLSVQSNMIISVCFSASKTFGVYGLRGGALIGLSRDQKLAEEFERISLYRARSTWSCPPTTPIQLLNILDENDRVRDAFINELNSVRSLLDSRAALFIEEAKSINLVTYPYTHGFFVTIPCEDPHKTYTSLMEKDIYVVPLNGSIRVALSALPIKDIKGLAKKIQEQL